MLSRRIANQSSGPATCPRYRTSSHALSFLTFGYDAAGNCTRLTFPDTHYTQYDYEEFGKKRQAADEV
jgi:YD repeat-containing protein